MTTDARARDADLVAALQRGDRLAAFDGVVARYAPRLHRLCWLLLRDDAAAEDAAQDSLLRVWRALPGYAPDRGALSTWVYAITRHHCLALLGRSQLVTVSVDEQDHPLELETPPLDPNGPLDAQSSLATLVRALPEIQRICLQLFYWEDRSVGDVAAQLGLPENTVKTHLHRARSRLRQALQAQGLDDPSSWF